MPLKIMALYFVSIACLVMLTGCPPQNGESDGENSNVFEVLQHEVNQVPSQMVGTVLLDGRPQTYGTVQVLDLEGFIIAQERASQTGHYRILDLLAGDYNVVYINAGGAPIGQPIRVRIRPGRFEQLDLEFTTGQ